MWLARRSFAVAAAAILVIGVGSVASAAKVKVKTQGKLSVPASMLKGSALTSGRTFYSSSVPENTLAGIRLGRPAREILGRWGNPTRITVGATFGEQGADQTQMGAPGAMPMMPGMPGPMYTPPGGMAPFSQGVNTAAGMLGMQSSPIGMLPPLPGMETPGATAQQQPGAVQQSAALSQEEVTWTYDLPSGITLEFIITDGLITQITVGGVGPWGLSKTRTGLQLGDTYKLVLWVCGYPESQKYHGRFLRASYIDKNRALFTFLDKKLVGVTIALVPQELEGKR